MNKLVVLLFVAVLFFTAPVSEVLAQQSFTVTDTQPITVEGLNIGYTIKSTEVKKVGDKGDYSRYSVKFFVTNTTTQGKIILYKQGWNLLNNVSDQLVQFNCLNATGARLTTKSAIINAEPCNVPALVDDKDCSSNKSTQNKRFVQIGYWIKAGETISSDGILICPLNEQPNIQAVYLAGQLQPSASASTDYSGLQQVAPQPLVNPQGFTQIRNVFNNTFINVETGLLRSSPITAGWWSAQWQLTPVPGTNYFTIKNRWKGTYISVEGGNIAQDSDGQLPQAMWLMEPTTDPNSFRIRNSATGGHLCTAANQLAVSNNINSDFSSAWVLEQL